jgi:hypothetical protein
MSDVDFDRRTARVIHLETGSAGSDPRRTWVSGGGRATLAIDLTLTVMTLALGVWATVSRPAIVAPPPVAASIEDDDDDGGAGTLSHRRIAAGSETTAAAPTSPTGDRTGRNATFRLDDPLGGGGKAFELALGANGSGLQVASAVGASTAQGPVDAVATEGTLERTDHGVPRMRRKVPAAAFAVGSEFEHAWLHRIEFAIR